MVYRGRPSKACKECRVRRLRCDQVPAGCGQCARARFTCSGYRDVTQLRLNNETKSIVARFQGAAKLLIPQIVKQSIELRARDMFFSNYVFGNLTAFDYLREFYFSTSVDEHVALSTDAASLAYFSTQIQCPEALKKARVKYGLALKCTNACLQSPTSAVKDATLLTVLLLDLCDKLMDRNQRDIQSWTNHMTGALSLIKLRGPEQFTSNNGLRMFSQFCANLIISCIKMAVPIPDELISLRTHAARFLDNNDPKWCFTDLMIRFVELQVGLNDHLWPEKEAMKRAEELEHEFAVLSMQLSSAWPYATVYMDAASNEWYERYFHVYSNHNIAHTWNVIRTMRIYLNEIIYLHRTSDVESLSAQSALDAGLDAQPAVDNIISLAAGICASVPQYVTFPLQQSNLRHSNAQSTESYGSKVPSNPNYSTPHSSRCYPLLYPLFIVGQSRHSPFKLKLWVTGQLRYIASSFGIQNALVIADILDRGEIYNPWSVYAMLGSNAFTA